MKIEEALAELHRKLATVNGEVAGMLARRRFDKKSLKFWRRKLNEAEELIDQLEKTNG